MSRFFRSGSSTPSSGSDQESEGCEVELDDQTTSSPAHAAPRPVATPVRSPHRNFWPGERATTHVTAEDADITVDRPVTDRVYSHRDFLLHALLEERCLNEALSSNIRAGRRPNRDSPEIQAEAETRYQRLCAQLASYNLISTGLEADQHAITRQRYRNGLDMLSQQRTSTTLPQPLRRLLTDTDKDAALVNKYNNERFPTSRGEGMFMRRADTQSPRMLLTGTNADAALFRRYNDEKLGMSRGDGTFFESRYRSEFEELSTLGRGGFGVVYHVRHRLDNQVYAIKKVPLSPARLQRIQRKGRSEVDEVLRELRTLARLDHPNIVRYFGGWIEWVDSVSPPALAQSDGESQVLSHDSEDVFAGAEDSRPNSLHRITTESSMEETDVVFEASDTSSTRPRLDVSATDTCTTNHSGHQLRRVGTRSTMATVSDETVESVGRYDEASLSIQSAASGVQFTGPVLALHMQMSLHPMTLADFLAPPTNISPGTAPPLTHCFHLDPSVSILLAVIEGIDYLHGEGIVHRDIKPANIFLGPHSNPRSIQGSVDLLLCNDCRAQGDANSIRLEVRIGDFGLVTVADPEGGDSRSEAVGTEVYRPLTAQPPNRSLDIYALGIVAFELVWKFDTRMERVRTIQRLKQGEFPHDFCARLGGKQAEPLQDCIKRMLLHEGDSISTDELKERLSTMLS